MPKVQKSSLGLTLYRAPWLSLPGTVSELDKITKFDSELSARSIGCLKFRRLFGIMILKNDFPLGVAVFKV